MSDMNLASCVSRLTFLLKSQVDLPESLPEDVRTVIAQAVEAETTGYIAKAQGLYSEALDLCAKLPASADVKAVTAEYQGRLAKLGEQAKHAVLVRLQYFGLLTLPPSTARD